MAYDEGMAQMLRDDLADHPFREQKMFGGIAFMLAGNMVCGAYSGGAMFRVGKDRMAAALALPGVAQMMMGGRPMSVMAECSPETAADDGLRGALMRLALDCVAELPSKVAKARKTR
ncbi:TfoX/Sxy family protein [Gemmobacter sp. LW-1]|uniref:TfoX/Sxy family protein n=1 Tax=Gemmobacter sp. LW-1 TaxID=1529005 RepID=UPI0006C7521B|nr:TfoX/Sxy family protein [Gemmobacter sp. LW-1]